MVQVRNKSNELSREFDITDIFELYVQVSGQGKI